MGLTCVHVGSLLRARTRIVHRPWRELICTKGRSAHRPDSLWHNHLSTLACSNDVLLRWHALAQSHVCMLQSWPRQLTSRCAYGLSSTFLTFIELAAHVMEMEEPLQILYLIFLTFVLAYFLHGCEDTSCGPCAFPTRFFLLHDEGIIRRSRWKSCRSSCIRSCSRCAHRCQRPRILGTGFFAGCWGTSCGCPALARPQLGPRSLQSLVHEELLDSAGL